MKQQLLAVALTAGLVSAAPAQNQPNVLFIAVDDLKPLLGCYGDKNIKSPNIDRLAKRGVLFERAYCNQAVCSPSRNALLTGLRPQTLGIYELSTNFRRAVPDAVTLPQTFMKAGYRTAALGKIFHVGHGNTEDAASWSVPHMHPGGDYADPATQADRRKRIDEARARGATQNEIISIKGPATESADVPDNAYADGKIADEAIKRLQNAKERPGQPFFLAVGFIKPHLPFCAPKKYWDLYDPAQFKLPEVQNPPEGAPSFAPQFGGELRQYNAVPKQGRLPDEMQRNLIHGYHAATSYMDAQLGRVLDALDANGQSKNTIIVLWGDHGWHLGDHSMWCKHTNYEEAARIPLIISAPGIAGGARTKAFVETVDIFPTLCELAGVPVATTQKIEGVSFANVLKNPQATARDAIIHVYPRGEKLGRAIRTDRYRMVEWKNPGAAADTAVFELYDYEKDPLETKNLAEAQPEVLAQLRAILAKHPEAKPQIGTAAAPARPAQRGPAQGGPDRAAMFARRDQNGDGKLTFEEFMTGQPDPEAAKGRFPLFDTNKDGVLSKDEFVFSGKAPAK